MKFEYRRLVILIVAGLACAWAMDMEAGGRTGRKTVNLNREWTYRQGDHPEATRDDYDDSGWEYVGLPHSFSMPYFMSADFYTGYGWYRKKIRLKKSDMDKELFLEFDGVFQETEVYVNGVLAGTHRGGYTGFNVPVSAYVREGENIIAVRVNNLWKPDIAPRGGEHVFSGGIYRNVRLVAKSRVHIGWYGIKVTTPDLEANAGKASRVRVSVEIRNSSGKDEDCELRISVKDGEGHVVAAKSIGCRLQAGTMSAFDVETEEITPVKLWSPSEPNLYTLEARIYRNGKMADNDDVLFGFRWFDWTADKGFFLNGSHFYFHGANVHQDQAGWGDAVTDSAMRRDVRMVKEAGFDMIRGSHYPHAPAFVEACDREGMLFWCEAPFWGTAGPKTDGWWTASAYPVDPADAEAFENNVLQQLEEMIRIHRNNPSVFVWSVSNEPFFTDGKTIGGMKRLLRKMVDKAHELDPTRVAAVGGAQRPLGPDRIDLTGDVAGYNGDGARIAEFRAPGIPSVVTEYGSTTADRPGAYEPGWGDLSEDEEWKGPEWRSGQAIWCAFDHGSIFGSQMGKMGIIDYFRLPKRAWYWYRNEYRRIPPPEWPRKGVPARIRLTASKHKGIRADGTDDVQLTATVVDGDGNELDASPDLRMRVVSGPGEFPTGQQIDFSADSDIRIAEGKASIAFRAYYAGRTVVEASAEGLAPGAVELEFVGAPKFRPARSKQVRRRPYVRFARDGMQGGLQSYGPGSPVFASSAEKGHPAGLAADGDSSTCWLSAEGDGEPYLMLDAERTLALKEVRVGRGANCDCPFEVQVSADRKEWTRLRTAGEGEGREFNWKLSNPVNGRFIKVCFLKGRAKCRNHAVSEISVSGLVAP